MKTAALVIIVTACSFIGLIKNLSLKNRLRQLVLISEYIDDMRIRAEMEKTPLYEIMREKASDTKNVFLKNLASDSESEPSKLYRNAKSKSGVFLDLKKQDYAVLDRFFSLLGKSGEQQQRQLFAQTLSELEKKRCEAETACSKYAGAALRAGLLTGLFITAVLI